MPLERGYLMCGTILHSSITKIEGKGKGRKTNPDGGDMT